MAGCAVEGCVGRHYAKGYCSAHYRRLKRHGDVLAGRAIGQRKTTPPLERFESHIDRGGPGGCWLWTAFCNDDGYGRFWPKPRWMVPAHAFAYAVWRGPMPAGTELDHTCRTRNCVNPDHLEAVTHHENLLRSPNTLASINAAKTECAQGHPYDDENTMHAHGRRYCLACIGERSRRGEAVDQ
ncbi:MAG TPA: HNH endonuclease [Acidimicrobiales bacterium]|nr:HNH endonuclease [Acidimicrobiales bacterium]